MSVTLWVIATFSLGIVSLALCYLFMEGCEKI